MITLKKYDLKSHLKQMDQGVALVPGYYANKRYLKIASLISDQLALYDQERFSLDWILKLAKPKRKLDAIRQCIESKNLFVIDSDYVVQRGPSSTKKLMCNKKIPANIHRTLLSHKGSNPIDDYIIYWLTLVCSVLKDDYPEFIQYNNKRGQIPQYVLKVADFSSYSDTLLRFMYSGVDFYILLEGQKGSIGHRRCGGKGKDPSNSLVNEQDVGYQSQDMMTSSVPKNNSSSKEVTLNESLLRECGSSDYDLQF